MCVCVLVMFECCGLFGFACVGCCVIGFVVVCFRWGGSCCVVVCGWEFLCVRLIS